MRSGVAGISIWRMPSRVSASISALPTARCRHCRYRPSDRKRQQCCLGARTEYLGSLRGKFLPTEDIAELLQLENEWY